ncbi:MAG: metal-dependent hydrolase [Bacteroidetes bacterium]|nr:MAG: metal-dependent hydrolase [Bacteroidota bacterium]
MEFTYYGHASFAVKAGGKNILFDPFISHNELAKQIDINKIPADYILLSHGHGDHVADGISIAQRTGAKVVCNFEIHEWLNNKGIANTHPMNTGGKWNFDFGTVKCFVAQHSSGLPDGSYGGNPMGFVISADNGTFYYSGDTALTFDMQLVPRYAKLDFAVLPIGDNFTMGMDDAVEAAKWIQCKKIIGVHYDTFGYIKIDHKKAIDTFKKEGIELMLVDIGKTIQV